jgi:hypothetical protein
MSAAEPRIEIVIDELLLHGVAQGDADATARALELRLASLGEDWAAAAGAAALPPPRDEAFRRLEPIQAPTASPGALGDAVAHAVWDGVGGSAR